MEGLLEQIEAPRLRLEKEGALSDDATLAAALPGNQLDLCEGVLSRTANFRPIFAAVWRQQRCTDCIRAQWPPRCSIACCFPTGADVNTPAKGIWPSVFYRSRHSIDRSRGRPRKDASRPSYLHAVPHANIVFGGDRDTAVRFGNSKSR